MMTLQVIPAFIVLLLSFPPVDSAALNCTMSSVAVNRNQQCAIVCQTPPADGGRVLLKIFNSSDSNIFRTVVVNNQFTGAGQNPEVIIDGRGIVTVAWEQSGDSRILVIVSRFDSTGRPLGDPITLMDQGSLANQTPRVALGNDGRFVVVWSGLGKGIIGQRFSKNGKKVGPMFQAVHKKTQNAQYPSVKMDKQNRIGIVWQDGSIDDFRIILRMFDWNLKPTRAVQVDQAMGLAYFSNPDLLFLRNGNTVVAWKDYRTGEANVYQQILNSALTPIGKNRRVNDDSGKQWQRLPKLASFDGSNYAMVWEDYRNDDNNQIADVYVQQFAMNGSNISSNRKIEVLREPTAQRFPAAAMKPDGDLIVTWSDSRWDTSTIYMVEVNSENREKKPESQVFP
ncbi:MAG: hypothetical protein EHM64_07755 [Ignavibacteriae bacterium]|nr:MAG: hypothetical protein EHM64_07755 [Ignavibacteriota bacterium]